MVTLWPDVELIQKRLKPDSDFDVLQLVCFGVPILDQQQEISNDRLEFLLEMYSKHSINFI